MKRTPAPIHFPTAREHGPFPFPTSPRAPPEDDTRTATSADPRQKAGTPAAPSEGIPPRY